jgi:hypothetical protein
LLLELVDFDALTCHNRCPSFLLKSLKEYTLSNTSRSTTLAKRAYGNEVEKSDTAVPKVMAGAAVVLVLAHLIGFMGGMSEDVLMTLLAAGAVTFRYHRGQFLQLALTIIALVAFLGLL